MNYTVINDDKGEVEVEIQLDLSNWENNQIDLKEILHKTVQKEDASAAVSGGEEDESEEKEQDAPMPDANAEPEKKKRVCITCCAPIRS